jgi:hypothetical protein
MALAMFGTIVTDLIGKAGGNVFQRGKFGSIFRRKGIPTNPQTVTQMEVRSHLTDSSMSWDALTDAQRVQWSNEAELYPENKKGRQVHLTGFAFFSKLNRNRQEIGESLLTGIPIMGMPEIFEGFSVEADTTPGTEDITLNLTPAINADNKVVVYATPRMRLGNRSSKKRLRKIGVLDHTFVSGGSIKDMYVARFGGMLQTGEKAEFQIKSVVIASGYASQPKKTYAVGTV